MQKSLFFSNYSAENPFRFPFLLIDAFTSPIPQTIQLKRKHFHERFANHGTAAFKRTSFTARKPRSGLYKSGFCIMITCLNCARHVLPADSAARCCTAAHAGLQRRAIDLPAEAGAYLGGTCPSLAQKAPSHPGRRPRWRIHIHRGWSQKRSTQRQ